MFCNFQDVVQQVPSAPSGQPPSAQSAHFSHQPQQANPAEVSLTLGQGEDDSDEDDEGKLQDEQVGEHHFIFSIRLHR